MLVDDYFYSFDLKTAGDYITKLRQLLEIKLNDGNEKSLESLASKDKESRKKSWQQLKEDWKTFGCSHCGFLSPNIWNHKRSGDCDDECSQNYPGDQELVKVSWKIGK